MQSARVFSSGDEGARQKQRKEVMGRREPEPLTRKIAGCGPALPGETLSNQEFARIAACVQENFGIKLPPAKKLMLEGRLRRRMKQTGFSSLTAYLDHVFSEEGSRGEFTHMVDAITTNKTDFFREPSHFDLLCRRVLPEFLNSGQSLLKIWSAACSSGEEPYTLAMVLNEFVEQHGSPQYRILASDISTRMLKKAHQAIYREDQITSVPLQLRKKYLLRSTDRAFRLVQICEGLRRQVAFQRINLMADEPQADNHFHLIFCRNVLIYFSKEDQRKVMCRLYRCLAPGGFLFIGHSENLAGMGTPFSIYAPTVYRRLTGDRN